MAAVPPGTRRLLLIRAWLLTNLIPSKCPLCHFLEEPGRSEACEAVGRAFRAKRRADSSRKFALPSPHGDVAGAFLADSNL